MTHDDATPVSCDDDYELEPVFAITRADLIEPVGLAQIERRERVVDPLGAVPDAPFGFLHPAWMKFRDGIGPDDTLWRFRSDWSSSEWWRERRSGYVAVRGDAIGPHFLCGFQQEFIDEPPCDEDGPAGTDEPDASESLDTPQAGASTA